MTAATRTVTGTIYGESGAAWASQSVVFKLLTAHATATDGSVAQKSYTLTTDANGDFTATLAVPASDAWVYACTLPDGQYFEFNLEAGDATTLNALQADANLSATASPSALSDLITAHAAVASGVHGIEVDGTPADNEILAWDTTAGKFINQTAAEAGLSGAAALDDITDVTITAVADDEVLAYDSGGNWINQTAAEAGLATASNLSSHTGNTSNPHSVTAAQVDAIPEDAAILSKSGAYELAAGDEAKIIECDGTFSITLPNGLDTGFQAVIVNIGSGTITLAATTTLTSKDSNVTLPNQYGAATVYHAGSNVWRAFGDLE